MITVWNAGPVCFPQSLRIFSNDVSQVDFLPVFSKADLGVTSAHISRASSKAVTLSRIARSSCLTADVWVYSNAQQFT